MADDYFRYGKVKRKFAELEEEERKEDEANS